MFVYENQKVITVNKASIDKEENRMKIKKEDLFNAIKELKHNELKVYIYLCSYPNGSTFALSPKDITDRVGGEKSSIQSAIRGLIDKGYLIESDEKNHFVFHGY